MCCMCGKTCLHIEYDGRYYGELNEFRMFSVCWNVYSVHNIYVFKINHIPLFPFFFNGADDKCVLIIIRLDYGQTTDFSNIILYI